MKCPDGLCCANFTGQAEILFRDQRSEPQARQQGAGETRGQATLSEFLGQACLPQHSVGCMPGFDCIVDNEFYPSYWTEPNFVIPLPLSVKDAPGFPQIFFQARCIVGHQQLVR